MKPCSFKCSTCGRIKCILDLEEKHKPRPASDKQREVWEKRKNTLTERQKEAIKTYCRIRNSGGDRTSKEYKQAYYIVRYLRDREKMLQQKKDRYKRLYLLEEP